MKAHLKRSVMGLIMAISASAAMAGADGPIEPAPVYDEVLNQISLREAEMLFEEGVQFYDATSWRSGPRVTSPARSSST